MAQMQDSEREQCREVTSGSGIERLLGLSVPALVAVAGFFSWIMLVNNLQISYWLYYERTVYLIYLGRSLDPIAWLLSSVLAVLLLAAAKKRRPAWLWPGILLLWLGIALGTLGLAGLGRLSISAGSLLTLIGLVAGANAVFLELAPTNRGYFVATILLALSLLILPAELGSLSYYVLSAFQPGTQVGRSWELFELQLWYTAFPLVPFLYVAFLFSWIWALVARILRGSAIRAVNEIAESTNRSESRAWILVIGAYIVLAAFVGYYAYFQSLTYPLVGTDIYWRNALPAERVVSSSSWVAAASRERHPLVVLAIAVVSNLLGLGVESLLRFAYAGLILAFGGAVFLLAFVGSRSKTLASFSALMTTISTPVAAGIYTGTIAEWVALIVWTLSLGLLAVNKDNDLHRWVPAALGLGFGSVVAAFVHPWTWIAMMLSLLLYAPVVVILRLRGVRREISAIIIAILFNLTALALGLVFLWKTQGWRVASAFLLVQESLGSKYFGLGTWEIVVFFSQIWSQFLNPVVLVLSILGILVVVQRRDRFAAIVLAWLVAACVTNVVAAPMGYDVLLGGRGQTQMFRAMFLVPFQIPAAAGLLLLKTRLDKILGETTRSQGVKLVVGIVVGVVIIVVLNGAFRALYPLLTDPHNYPNPFAP